MVGGIQSRMLFLPLRKVFLPPDNAPNGNVPVGVRPFNCRTLSLSSRSTENTRAILPIARILFRITSLRAVAAADGTGIRVWPTT